MSVVFTNGREIGNGNRPYIIAEVNSSHNGSVELAKKMIDASVDAGCSCVKFQSWSTESLYSKTYYDENPIAKRFVKKFSLNEEKLLEVMNYCRRKGIDFSSTPYSNREVDFLVNHDVPYIKIASMEINNYPFLKYIASKQMPIILSTGMSDFEEIRKAVSIIESTGNHKICLLHCISIYPAEPEIINLNNIKMLKNEFPEYPIGFSDHSLGMELACAAIALGADIIEKHLTLDKNRIGMDNQMAIEPGEMNNLVAFCNNVWAAMGSYERLVSDAEIEQRTKMRRSLIYTRDMSAGEIITENDVYAKRPGTGISPDRVNSVIGNILIRDIREDTLICSSDFKQT
ncbi:MAG: N-acetylneuraminate synthase family protein [Lachnospiraceae bacterium]|nr:N-acetylneuraminate synthase family protein [Lachnospiraceae bacterium]